MEKYLSKQTEDCLNDLIEYIKKSKSYKQCLELKTIMNQDKNLLKLIEEVKQAQKNHVKNNFSKETEKIVNAKMDLLNNNKTYTLYLYYLSEVNDMIDIIKKELNDYFCEITNIL